MKKPCSLDCYEGDGCSEASDDIPDTIRSSHLQEETASIMEPQNKTKQDAWERVLTAKYGSLTNEPTELYLRELRQYLYEFIGEVDGKLYDLAVKQAAKEAREKE